MSKNWNVVITDNWQCLTGTPITRPPVLGNQDLDLFKLYKIVQEHGGMEKVGSHK